MDRVFSQNGHNPKEVTAIERLAYLGDRCMGALSYEPELDLVDESKARCWSNQLKGAVILWNLPISFE